MDNTEELQRLISVLRSNGWTTKQAILDTFDEDVDWAVVEGIGPVRAPLMEALMGLSAEEWADVVEGDGLTTGDVLDSREGDHRPPYVED